MPSLILGTMNILNPYRSVETTMEEESQMIRSFLLHTPSGWLDSAYYYGKGASQARLGLLLHDREVKDLPRKIASKVNPWYDNDFSSGRLGALSRSSFQLQLDAIYSDLGTVDRLFLHAYDTETPLSETLDILHECFRKERFFTSWGLSNFSLCRIHQVVGICEETGLVLPKTYQGMYNMFCRSSEEVFSTIRDFGMDFWAYNPLCGGLLMKPPLETKGRFDNPVYQSIFGKPTFAEACDKFRRHFPTKEERLSYSLAWYSSCFSSLEERGSIIIGATSLSQLEQNLKIWDIYTKDTKDDRMEKGVLENIEDLYNSIKKEDEPIYYYE